MLAYRRVVRMLFVVAVEAALAGASVAAGLAGVVYSEASNQRISHASVWLCDDGGNRLLEAVTTDEGQFAFQGLHSGPYILKVNAGGYDPVEMDVNVSFGTEHGISIFLKSARSSSKTQANGASISAHELSMPEAARKLADAGKKKLNTEHNPSGALQDLQSAVKKAPDYYEAYYQIGMVYLALQSADEAEKNLEKAVELSRENLGESDLALAMLLIAKHDTARGEELLRKGLELNPNSWMGFFELGKLELYRNHLEAALEAAQRAKELAPAQPMVYRLMSLIHLRQKNDAAALVDLDAYIKLDPDSAAGETAKKIRVDTQERLEKTQVGPAVADGPH
jgi:tetratricopeptide (TPR) repeat protein